MRNEDSNASSNSVGRTVTSIETEILKKHSAAFKVYRGSQQAQADDFGAHLSKALTDAADQYPSPELIAVPLPQPITPTIKEMARTIIAKYDNMKWRYGDSSTPNGMAIKLDHAVIYYRKYTTQLLTKSQRAQKRMKLEVKEESTNSSPRPAPLVLPTTVTASQCESPESPTTPTLSICED